MRWVKLAKKGALPRGVEGAGSMAGIPGLLELQRGGAIRNCDRETGEL